MTELNPLFEAMNNIDDDIIASAQAPVKRKRLPLRVGIIAAAAVFLLIGAAAIIRNEVRLPDGRTLDIRLEVQEGATVPAEFKSGSYDIPPSRIFEMFNISALLNDNFIEPASTEVYLGYSFVDGKVNQVQFVYEPVYKENGAAVWISAKAAFSEEVRENGKYDSNWGEGAFKFIPINNGSEALIVQRQTAYFTYNGIFYQIIQRSIPNGENDHDVENILKGLGVL